MRPNPRLIPRLDVEFGLDDLRLSIQSGEIYRRQAQVAMRELFPEGSALFLDSGRTSLYLALKAMGFKKGARVGVPLYTCEAVFGAVARAGCTPVFLDIDRETYTLDPRDLERKANHLDAVVPVHVFGHAVDMDAVLAIASHAKVIEDCAHGLGSLYKGKPVGGLGDACFYSFRPGKPLSVGNMGLLICKSEETYRQAVKIAHQFPSYSNFQQAFNSLKELGRGIFYQPPWFGAVSLPVGLLMDEKLDFMGKFGFSPHLTADGTLAIFAERLRKYPTRLRRAQENVRVLSETLSSSGIKAPLNAEWAVHTYFQFALRFETEAARDGAMSTLAKEGIDSIKFYHDSPQLALRYGYKRDCPVVESIARTVLTIPCYGRLSRRDIDRIADALRKLGGAA